MSKTDYISGTEDAYKVQDEVKLELVLDDSLPRSYKVVFKCESGVQRIIPKSVSRLEVEPDGMGYHKRSLIVKKWFLEKLGVKYLSQ